LYKNCGLKTKSNEETWPALQNMVKAAQALRKKQKEAEK
jgi:methionine synthase II (cobalamin-independent)